MRLKMPIALLFSVLLVGGVAPTPARIGVFLDEEPIVAAPTEMQLELLRAPEAEGLVTANFFCAAAGEGFSAVIAPPLGGQTLESLCAMLQIPFIQTRWTPMRPLQAPTTFNLYPDADLLAQGLAALVRSLDWERFVLLYEEAELAMLQDVLKLQQFDPSRRSNSVMLMKLGAGPDYRGLLKEVAMQDVRRVVLHCAPPKVHALLQQGVEVGLWSDFSTSVFLSDLDAHTLDLTQLDIEANVTAVRLGRSSLPLGVALQLDALQLLADALKGGTDAPLRNCSVRPGLSGLVQALRATVVPEGVTGELRLENGRRDTFELQLIEVRSPQKPIGLWGAGSPHHVHLTRNATEIERQFRERMRTHNFIVSSKLGDPWLMDSGISGASGNARYKGYAMDLIEEVAKLMEVQFQFVLTSNKTTPGIVDDLMRRKADLGVCDFTITQERSEQIDFSLPIMSLGISILHKETEQEAIDNMYGFMRPFSINVWLYTITLYLVLSIAILLIARLDPDDWENPHPCNPRPDELENIWGFKNCLWLTLGSIMTQGCDILPKGICSRLATAMWWFFSLIMTSTYTANLAAFLTMSRKEEAIKSVEDLANQNKVKYGVMANGSTQAFFETSTNSLYQKMWATMKNENPPVIAATNTEGVERVLSTRKGLYAFFMESPQIEYVLARQCGLKKIDQYLDSKSYGIGMPLGADYRRSINWAVLQLQETGKILELKAKWWKEGAIECSQGGAEGNKDELGLANVGGVFVVLAAGILLALLFAIGEFLWNVYSISVQEQMGYLEALRSEAKFACNIRVTRKAAKPSPLEPEGAPVERSILTGAGSVLNINASLLNRLGRQ